jgi:hypothetical protein
MTQASKSTAIGPLPIIQKTYDLYLWLTPKLARFPKSEKFILGDRIANRLLDFLGSLVEAEFTSHKLPVLERANIEYEQLRMLVRMSNDLHLLGVDGYRYYVEHTVEIGKMLGGWIKQQSGRKAK